MASIIVAAGNTTHQYYPLGRRTNVIGRSESLLIQILDDQISRKHLQIRYDQGSQQYWALDMDSRNGVYINGGRIEEETPLTEGDRIMIGSVELLFTYEDFSDAESALHHYKKAGERGRPTFLGEA